MPGVSQARAAAFALLLVCACAEAGRTNARVSTFRASRRSAPLHAQSPSSVPLLALRGGMSVPVGWAILFSATGCELVSTGFMHKAQGFRRPLASAFAVLFYAASFLGFNLSLRALEISIAYAVWSAVVMALLALGGMTLLGESVSALKIAGVCSIIVGTVCLSLTDQASQS